MTKPPPRLSETCLERGIAHDATNVVATAAGGATTTTTTATGAASLLLLLLLVLLGRSLVLRRRLPFAFGREVTT
jgi:hypothetical protein